MNIALIGVGLIGGSFARAALACGVARTVVGVDRDPQALEAAERLGAISAGAPLAAAVRQADLVVLAVPVRAMPEALRAIAPHLRPDALLTDVGSTKCSVIEAARAALGPSLPRFVPGHPIAGRERPGVEASEPGLFRGKLYISTPIRETDTQALERVESVWRQLGARVERMEPGEHDAVFASVSHLPHLLAFALVAQIAREPEAERKLGLAGAGFRDFTRIAASSPAMWRDVCLANAAAVGGELRAYRALLDQLQAALDAGDADTLEAVFRIASDARRTHAPRLDAE